MTAFRLKLVSAEAQAASQPDASVLQVPNDTEVSELALQGVERIELQFPKFSDGRAYSQAFLLRRRLGFAGDIRAVGDVLVDQLVQMQRTGFSSAVLRPDQDVAVLQRQFDRFPRYYQGDAVTTQPLFTEAA